MGTMQIASGQTVRRIRIILAALTLLLPSWVVHADEVTGRVAIVDSDQHTITLTSGITFQVAEDILITALKPGEDIRITFARENGVLIAIKLSRTGGDA